MGFLETGVITTNWIERCPLNGLHLYVYIAFKALNMNGTDIVGLTFKLLNPGDVMRVLESERGRKREREGARDGDGERVGVDGLGGVRRAEERRQRGGLGGCVRQ